MPLRRGKLPYHRFLPSIDSIFCIRYLQSLTFAIFSRDEELNRDTLLETYQFNMSYPNEDCNKFMLNGQKVTRDNLKQQAITLIRSLIEFSGTLEQLPGDRWITLRIQVKRI